MGTNTARLQLYKSAEVGETINVKIHVTDAFDKIDANIGWIECTSTTRPASPWPGMPIFETDTKNGYVWDDATDKWEYSFGPGVAVALTFLTGYKASTTEEPFRIMQKGRYYTMGGSISNNAVIAGWAANAQLSLLTVVEGVMPALPRRVPMVANVNGVGQFSGSAFPRTSDNALLWSPATAHGAGISADNLNICIPDTTWLGA